MKKILICLLIIISCIHVFSLKNMVNVEKGSFIMGSKTGKDNEKPAYKVTFTYNFAVSKYEVTVGEWKLFVKETEESFDWENNTYGKMPVNNYSPGDNYPIINVSWQEAIAFCNWMSQKEKIPKAYDKEGNFIDKNGKITNDITKVEGYRLGTESEWEYAAKGGNKSKNNKYSGVSDTKLLIEYMNTSDIDDGFEFTSPVGKYKPNELGIFDMSGNVWEWCSDWYNDYNSKDSVNRYSYKISDYKVVKGGSWHDSFERASVIERGYDKITERVPNIGFRIFRTIK